jgi:hypothetical protein
MVASESGSKVPICEGAGASASQAAGPAVALGSDPLGTGVLTAELEAGRGPDALAAWHAAKPSDAARSMPRDERSRVIEVG